MTAVKPWKIGEEATYVVGVRGTLEARTDDTVTIAGHTLPSRLGGSLFYASIDAPKSERCDRDHCNDSCGEVYHDDCCNHGDIDGLLAVIETEHDEQLHPGAFRFCRNALCAAAREVRSGA